ncbi:MAG: EamA family transporter [Oscillospiraceae bacterium]|nr:EamA family transporter [Oscillospiraceae bacterium]MBR2807308.1 EamA family transporter [Oscillospiraceae bacterium]
MNSYIWFIVLSVLVASFSQILLKKSATKEYPNRIREYLNPYVITGYGMMVVSTVLTVIAYTRVDFKNGPIIESAGYVIVLILSRMFFKEKITTKKFIGTVLIIIGIVIFYT